jgi:hypothetical protein
MYKDAVASESDWRQGSAERVGSLSGSPKRDIITLLAPARGSAGDGAPGGARQEDQAR